MAKNEDLLHRRPSQVEVAIGQPQLFVRLGTVHLERRGRRRIVNDQVAGADFDPPGLEPGVFLAAHPRGHHAFDADDILVAQLPGQRLQLGPSVRFENNLCDSIAIAEIDEEQAAEVAPGVNPAVDHDVLPDMLGGQVATRMSSFQ